MGLVLWAVGALMVAIWLGTWVIQIAIILAMIAFRLAALVIYGIVVAGAAVVFLLTALGKHLAQPRWAARRRASAATTISRSTS